MSRMADGEFNEIGSLSATHMGASAVTALYTEARRARDSEAELLEALKLAQRWLSNCVPVAEIDGPKPLPVIDAAIAKATGGQP